MKVEVKDSRGVVKAMDDRYARILTKLGRVTYMTRDMNAVQVTNPVAPAPVVLATPVEAAETLAREEQAVPDKPIAKRKYTRKAKAKK